MTPEQKQAAGDAIRRLIAELDAFLKQASVDLNTVRAKERVAQWQKQTVPLLSAHVGALEAKRFGDLRPGPSFTNDLLEELSDEIEVYRTFLNELAQRIGKSG